MFAKIAFTFTMIDIAGSHWHLEINGLSRDAITANGGFIVNGISLGFNWITYEMSPYFLEHTDDFWDANANTQHHIANGTNNSHRSGWNNWSIEPDDPNFHAKILQNYFSSAV